MSIAKTCCLHWRWLNRWKSSLSCWFLEVSTLQKNSTVSCDKLFSVLLLEATALLRHHSGHFRDGILTILSVCVRSSTKTRERELNLVFACYLLGFLSAHRKQHSSSDSSSLSRLECLNRQDLKTHENDKLSFTLWWLNFAVNLQITFRTVGPRLYWSTTIPIYLTLHIQRRDYAHIAMPMLKRYIVQPYRISPARSRVFFYCNSLIIYNSQSFWNCKFTFYYFLLLLLSSW